VRIRVSFYGILERLAGSTSIDLELPDGSTCREAMRQLGKRLGDQLPAEVWDAEQEVFTPLVAIFVNYKEVEDLAQPLQNDSEVLMLMPLAGG